MSVLEKLKRVVVPFHAAQHPFYDLGLSCTNVVYRRDQQDRCGRSIDNPLLEASLCGGALSLLGWLG